MLSTRAAAILELMEPDRGYGQAELRTLVPDLNAEALHDVMHELWIGREVERFQGTGWRRVRPVPPAAAGDPVALRVGHVRPQDLFDHDSFSEWFK